MNEKDSANSKSPTESPKKPPEFLITVEDHSSGRDKVNANICFCQTGFGFVMIWTKIHL